MTHHSNNSLHTWTAVLKEDPKKAVILTILAVVMLVLWGRTLFSNNSGPKAAVAAVAPTAAKPSSDKVRNVERSGASSHALQEWVRQPVGRMSRNLFAVKLDYFPRDPSRLEAEQKQLEKRQLMDHVAKSGLDSADQDKQRQAFLQNLRDQAASLRLETIVMGATPKALINGSLVGEGDVVASFRVLKIEARRISVEREGIRLEILMR